MSGVMHSIGNLGAQSYVRKIAGTYNPGWRDVDPTATFISGTIGKLANVGGKIVMTPVTAVTDTPVGIFWVDKTASFYKTVKDEAVAFGGPLAGANIVVNLQNVNLKTGSIRVTTAAGVLVPDLAANYVIDLVHGTFTAVTGGALAGEESCLISYWSADASKYGLDQTVGSGKVTSWEGIGEVGTLVYDTTQAYTLGGGVYFTADGIPTSNSAGGAVKIGTITKAPSASSPELCFKVIL
jgi:hypothetical protein